MTVSAMKTQPKKAIALPLNWLVVQYLPRHRFSVIISRAHTRVQAIALKEHLCIANSALNQCLTVEPADQVLVVDQPVEGSLLGQ